MKVKELTASVVRLALKVFKLNEKARKENLACLKDDIDTDKCRQRDIFEYGLQLCASGVKAETLEKILSNLINMEHNDEEKRFKIIQKEAVLHIQKGSHSDLFLWDLISLLKKDELEEVKNILSGSYSGFSGGGNFALCARIREKLNAFTEKPDYNEVIYDSPEKLSDIAPRPFDSFNMADIKQLSQILKDEKPEVVSYVLACIEPKKAAAVLSSFPAALQSDISYRIAVMDIPGIESIWDIHNIENKLLSLSGKSYKAPAASEFAKVLKINILREKAVNEARDLYEKASKANTGEYAGITNNLLRLMQGRPVDFIKTNPVNFLNLLQEEHPKTIAFILCLLEPQKAAFLLSFLPPRLQCDAASRIALMDTASFITPEMRDTVAIISPDDISIIEKYISAMYKKDCVIKGGIEKLTELLLLCESGAYKTIIEFMENVYPRINESINDLMFVFDDIVMLDDRAVQRVLQFVDARNLPAALKYANVKSQEKIFNNITLRAAAMLKEDIECIGPVSADECAKAQKNIVSVIRHLEETGQIILDVNIGDQLVK